LSNVVATPISFARLSWWVRNAACKELEAVVISADTKLLQKPDVANLLFLSSDGVPIASGNGGGNQT
jgi:2-phospho-L-lactate guanylyltransferase (CobY/MobA/RfbA family)